MIGWQDLARPKLVPMGSPMYRRLMGSPHWVAQEKIDGVRCLVTVCRGKTTGISRSGKVLEVPRLDVGDMVLDCELLGGELWVFDRVDRPELPLSARLMRIPETLRTVGAAILGKEEFLRGVFDRNGEGVVLKCLQDEYPPSGGADWYKVKR